MRTLEKLSKTRNLLVRLRDHQHQVLLFARDLAVPSQTTKPNATYA